MSIASRKGEAAFDLQSTYIHLTDGADAIPLEVGPDFWEQLQNRTDLGDGRLVCMFHFTEDWPNAEMHPAGDEIVCLLSGSVDLVFEEDAGDRIVPLRNRGACIVPRGTWHRAVVHTPSDMLFITRGAGTQHRPA